MWVKSRKVGPGKRQRRWDDGALTMHEREEQRRQRVQALLKQPVEHLLRVIAAIGRKGTATRRPSPVRDDVALIAFSIVPIVVLLVALVAFPVTRCRHDLTPTGIARRSDASR